MTSSTPSIFPKHILVDTDPGVDDAFALLALLGKHNKDLKIEGMSMIWGNAKSVHTLGANAKLITRMSNPEYENEIPIHVSEIPDIGNDAMQPTMGNIVHGLKDGLGDVTEKYINAEERETDLDPKNFPELPAHDFLYKKSKELFDRTNGTKKMTIICLGPLTNLAMAMEKYSDDFLEYVEEIVIMGGACGEPRGNRTPTAEANFMDNPEAARDVFNDPKIGTTENGKVRIVLADLSVCVKSNIDDLRQKLKKFANQSCPEIGHTVSCPEMNPESTNIDNSDNTNSTPSNDKIRRLADFAYSIAENYIDVVKNKFGGCDNIRAEPHAAAYDVLAAMYVLKPELFTKVIETRVEVETEGKLTRGMSVADWKGQWGKEKNCALLVDFDREGFDDAWVKAVCGL